MSDERSNGGVILKWAHLAVILTVQVALMGAVWGSLSYQVTDHSRRLDLIEKREVDQYMPRPEFEKRHEELEKRVEENRERIQQIEAERLAELQGRKR